ncbi:hypothetical protein ANTQUA_LOCUS7633 [Anthophora quadrimaculata]
MNKIIKKLIRDSIVIRNCSVLQTYNVIQSHAYFSEDAPAYRASEIVKINSSRTANEIRNTIKDIMQTHKIISLQDAIHTVYKLDNMFKKQELHYTKLKKIEEVTHLFEVIHKNMRFLHMRDIIHILKILVNWHVPHYTTLVQTLLQLICASMNDLSIGQTIVVHNILRKMKQCQLTNSLDIALVQVFKQQAKFELNSESTNLSTALKFAISINDRNTIHHIVNILAVKPNNLHISNVVPIYAVLHNAPETLDTKQLLFHIRHIIKNNFNNLTLNEIIFILNYMCKSCLNNTMKLYDESIIFVLYYGALKSNFTFHQNITVLKYLNIMRYSCVDFLKQLTLSCIKNRDNIDKSPLEDIIHFVEGFVIADYKPNGWKFLELALEDYVTNVDCTVQKAVSITFSLLSLDCYYPKLLEKVFILYNKVTIINNKMTLDILKLYWCVKLLYSASNYVLPDKSKLNEVKIGPEEGHISCLMESLKEACGNDKYIKGGLKTKWGLLVDNIVVRQPDGSLLDISSYDNITFIEELASLSECDKILFIALKKEAYSINIKNMLSTVKIQLKAIKQLPGYHVFVVDPFLWENLLHKEKVAHLQQAIQKNCSNISNI